MRRQDGASAEALGQQGIAAGSDIQKIQEALEMRRQFKQPQRMTKGRGIYYDVVIIFALEQFLDSQQPGHLRHAGQGSIEQRSDLFFGKECSILDDAQDGITAPVKKVL